MTKPAPIRAWTGSDILEPDAEMIFQLSEKVPCVKGNGKISQDGCLNAVTRPNLFCIPGMLNAALRRKYNFHLGIINTLEVIRAKKAVRCTCKK